MIINKEKDFTGIYEDGNYRIIGKMGINKSLITEEEYNIVTDIKIIDINDNSIVYEVKNNNHYMAYDKADFINMVTYAEKIVFYLNNETCDIYWKRLFLDKFFIECNTFQLELFYRNVSKRIEKEKQIKETEETRNIIDSLKQEIRIKYNKNNIAVFYDLFNIYLINESKVICQQNNIDREYIKMIEKNIELYTPYILNHIQLNWDDSDINILNDLLTDEQIAI